MGDSYDAADFARAYGLDDTQAVVDAARTMMPKTGRPAAALVDRSGSEPLRIVHGLGPEDSGRQPIIKGLMGRGELSAVYGPPKSGKSFLMTSAALAVAAGDSTWFGHKLKQHGLVLYLVLEGASGFRARLQAWARHHDRMVPERFARASENLRFLADPSHQNAAADVERIKAAVTDLERQFGEPVVLIVIDTVARAMAGGDENSAQDMGRFLDACGELQRLPSRPHVAVVHHAGKDNERGTRGSSALPAGVDALVKVERGDKRNKWRVEWAKDDPETDWKGFRLEGLELGCDEDGDAITSCVVLAADAPTGPKPCKAPRGNNQKLVWRALCEVEGDPKRKKRATMLTDVPMHAVDANVVRQRAYALAEWQPGKEHDRYREALKGLIANGLVTMDERKTWVWRTEA
jgi:hypothetical protein